MRLSPGGQSVEFRFGHAHRFLFLIKRRKEKKKIKNPISSVTNGWPEQETIKGRLRHTKEILGFLFFVFSLGALIDAPGNRRLSNKIPVGWDRLLPEADALEARSSCTSYASVAPARLEWVGARPDSAPPVSVPFQRVGKDQNQKERKEKNPPNKIALVKSCHFRAKRILSAGLGQQSTERERERVPGHE